MFPLQTKLKTETSSHRAENERKNERQNKKEMDRQKCPHPLCCIKRWNSNEKFRMSNLPCRNISEMIIHIAATKLNQLQNPLFFLVMFKQLYAYTALIFSANKSFVRGEKKNKSDSLLSVGVLTSICHYRIFSTEFFLCCVCFSASRCYSIELYGRFFLFFSTFFHYAIEQMAAHIGSAHSIWPY